MPTKTLHFPNARHASALYCGRPDNLVQVERQLGAAVTAREEWIRLDGEEAAVARADTLFALLNDARTQGLSLKTPDFLHVLDGVAKGEAEKWRALFGEPVVLATNRRSIVPKTLGQKAYLQAIQQSSIVFGIGPAGTGKTYLAVAAAVAALLKNQVQRVVLARPAVEAGEALGFLPGDLREKILPYLRPLYDAMYDMLEREEVTKLMERGAIEIAPLAYMRGRTLANAFVILDEAQNATAEQMMMFLTRLGDESRMVITGDVTQIDLPRSRTSGLVQVQSILRGIPGIEFHHFAAADVVRHPLVLRIIEAYENHRRAAADREERPAETRAGNR